MKVLSLSLHFTLSHIEERQLHQIVETRDFIASIGHKVCTHLENP